MEGKAYAEQRQFTQRRRNFFYQRKVHWKWRGRIVKQPVCWAWRGHQYWHFGFQLGRWMTEGRTHHVVNVESFLHYLECVIFQNRPLEKFSCSPFFHLDLTEPAPSNCCEELPYRPILSLNTPSKAEGRFLLSLSIPRVCVKKWSSFAMTGVRGKKGLRYVESEEGDSDVDGGGTCNGWIEERLFKLRKQNDTRKCKNFYQD